MLQTLVLLLAAALAGEDYQAAQLAFQQRQFEAALRLLSKLPAGEADTAPVQNLKALVLSELHRYPAAREAIARARQLDGRSVAYVYNAALIHYDADEFAAAARLLSDAIGQFGASAPLLSALGEAQFRLNQFEEAQRTLRRALSFEANNVAALVVLARLYRATGQLDQFGTAVSKAFALAPQNYEACFVITVYGSWKRATARQPCSASRRALN